MNASRPPRIRNASALVLGCLVIVSVACESNVATQKPVAASRVETLDLWSCESDPWVLMPEPGRCPVCAAPLLKMRIYLTYEEWPTFSCREHSGVYESFGHCPQCDEPLREFVGERLVKERRVVLDQ